jgi:leader peptidase (prepilin peptidase)/N-methyltransferase
VRVPDLPTLLPLLTAPLAGSFVGVLIRRLPAGRGVAWSRSACEHCGGVLRPFELVPLASYLVQRGRCRRCGAPIAAAHLWVELAALLAPLMLLAAGVTDPAALWCGCVLGWGLLALGWIDAVSMMLPDAITLPLLLIGLAQCWWRVPGALADHALAAILAWASLQAVAIVYRRVRHREGLGQGDAKLFAAGAAWTGLGALSWVLLIAALLGLATAGVARLRGQRVSMTTRLPFGPALAAAVWAVWLGQAVLAAGWSGT